MPVKVRIAPDEWHRVARLTSAVTPGGDGGSVWLRSDGEARRWIGCRDDLDWLVMGDGDGQTYEAALPPALIWFAAELSRRDGDCTLTLVRADLATVESSAGQATFDLTPSAGPDLARWPETGTRATVEGERFRHMLTACCRSSSTRPDAQSELVWLATEMDRLAASPHVSHQDVTYRTVATTNGRASAAVAGPPLLSLLSILDAAIDGPDLTIDFPESPHDSLGVRGEDWGALVPTVDATVHRWSDDLEVALRTLDRTVTQAGSDVFHVHLDGRVVRVALHDGPPEVARVSLVLARGVSLTPELRVHVNRANQILTVARLWLAEDGELIAAADVRCSELHMLGPTIDLLTDQLLGLDVLLPALAD